jgi:hypothetical protein
VFSNADVHADNHSSAYPYSHAPSDEYADIHSDPYFKHDRHTNSAADIDFYPNANSNFDADAYTK